MGFSAAAAPWRLHRRRPGRNYLMQSIVAVVIMQIAFMPGSPAANVGVVDAGDEFSDLDRVVETIQALGHRAEKLPADDLLRPTGVGHYDCVILAHRSGPLTEAGYRALDEYVREGGTLLLTGLAAYWMKPSEAGQARIRIAGAGPLAETAGTTVTSGPEKPIHRLLVTCNDPATAGLTESFTPQTMPPYDIRQPASWRHAGVYVIQALSATPLIKVETVDAQGGPVTADFLTVKISGRGRCYRLAMCRLAPLVFEKKEQNISLVLQNILKQSTIR